MAYQKSWLALKKQWSEVKKEKKSPSLKRKFVFLKPLLSVATTFLVVITFAVLYFLSDDSEQRIEVDKNEIQFGVKKSISNSIPNSVVFSYDVKSINADSFFIQQSWDESRRVKIDQQNTKQTDIYYVPGYFNAQLIANTQVIKEIPVHITNKNWFVAVRQPFDNLMSIDRSYWLDKGCLGVKPSIFDQKISAKKELQLSFYWVKDFGLDGDNFSFHSRFIMTPVESIVCPIVNVKIKGEYGLIWIMFGKRGCESELGIIFGDVHFSGKTNDLLPLGTDIYEWQKMAVLVKAKEFIIKLNEKTRFTGQYERSIGEIKEISYFFQGIGSIDDVVLADSLDNIKFSDNFN